MFEMLEIIKMFGMLEILEMFEMGRSLKHFQFSNIFSCMGKSQGQWGICPPPLPTDFKICDASITHTSLSHKKTSQAKSSGGGWYRLCSCLLTAELAVAA